ncbi:hypothetical protein P7C70_g4754, partial [Phenoliferia sp. Uapishka_3]
MELKEHIILLVHIQDVARKSRLEAVKADRKEQEQRSIMYGAPPPAPTGLITTDVAIPPFPCLAALRLVNKELARLGASRIFSERPRKHALRWPL